MNEIPPNPVKPPVQSLTLWFNFLVLLAEGILQAAPDIQAALPMDWNTFRTLILAIVGNTVIRLLYTRQPITYTAAFRPLTGTVLQAEAVPSDGTRQTATRLVIKRRPVVDGAA